MATFSAPAGAVNERDAPGSSGSSSSWSDVEEDESLGSAGGRKPAKGSAACGSQPSTDHAEAWNREATNGTIVVHHPSCELHKIPNHPERPGRVRAIMKALKRNFPDTRALLAPKVEIDQVLRFHCRSHVDKILGLCSESEKFFRAAKANTEANAGASTRAARCGRRQGVPKILRAEEELCLSSILKIDGDTAVMSASREAILRAAGAACFAVDEVMSGRARNAFCCVRPPGHHAEPDVAMGFCFFNNAPIGALHAQAEYAAERVAIVDIDVHHGNGTQAAFAKNPSTFYASTHQGPHFYPGTGFDDEKGVANNVVNVSMENGEGSRGFRKAYSKNILPALEAFRPGLIVISAGFDAHNDDPLAGIALNEDDYGWVTRKICAVAGRVCGGRVVSILEGGYNLQAIADSAVEHVRALREAAAAAPFLPRSPSASSPDKGDESLEAAARATELSSAEPLSGGDISNAARPQVEEILGKQTRFGHTVADGEGRAHLCDGTGSTSSATTEESALNAAAVAGASEITLAELLFSSSSDVGVGLSGEGVASGTEELITAEQNLPETFRDCVSPGHSDGVIRVGWGGTSVPDPKGIEECSDLMAQLGVNDGAD